MLLKIFIVPISLRACISKPSKANVKGGKFEYFSRDTGIWNFGEEIKLLLVHSHNSSSHWNFRKRELMVQVKSLTEARKKSLTCPLWMTFWLLA